MKPIVRCQRLVPFLIALGLLIGLSALALWEGRLVVAGLAGVAMFCLLGMAIQTWRLQRGERRTLIMPVDYQYERERFDRSESRFRALLESLPRVAVQGYDRDRRVIYWNAASTRLYGYLPDEAYGRRLEELIIPADMREAAVQEHLNWIHKGTEIAHRELELKHRSGRGVAVFSHHVMLGQHTDNPLMFCVDVDLSVQKEAYRELAFIQHYDPLTLLPNRPTFISQLDRMLGAREPLAVFFIDIEGFSRINDSLGYELGNELLRQMANRLSEGRQGGELLGRFGNDEFLMAFPQRSNDRGALAFVDRINAIFDAPFRLGDSTQRVGVSLGISLYPDNGESAEELIYAANVARNRAGRPGESRFQLFSAPFHNELIRQHEMLKRLERALEKNELAVHYQPQIALSGRIESLEALLRWFPADGGMVSPGEFIPLAERFGLIGELGQWLINEVCRQQSVWKAEGLTGYRIDINLSGEQLHTPDVLIELDTCLQNHGLDMRDIGIEITENVLVRADSEVLEVLGAFYHRGLRIAIDDFGTGYSSLAYLKQFPVSSLKIDRSFVIDAPSDLRSRAILAGIIFIAHQLGIEVVAEGVETSEQLALVHELRVDLVQGFFHFRPMSADSIRVLIERQPLIERKLPAQPGAPPASGG